MSEPANIINHVAINVDASSSVAPLEGAIVKVVDQQVADLAETSRELDQETRVSVYLFADEPKCLIYDKDVLRLPSIRGRYKARGQTALIDSTMLSLADLDLTPQKYGEHFFVDYTITDGEENNSVRYGPSALLDRLTHLPSNWVAACFVPNQRGVLMATKFGFPRGSVEVWDAASVRGAESMGERMRAVTNRFLRADVITRRAASKGGVFTMDVDNLDPRTVSTHLRALLPHQYRMYNVNFDADITRFVEETSGRPYVRGSAYYQITKVEKVQPQKAVCVYDRSTNLVYTGPQARDLLGLPDHEVRVHPNDHPTYDLFVQSTSVNRRLVPGTRLLVLS